MNKVFSIKTYLPILGSLVGIGLFVIAAFVLHHELKNIHYHDIIREYTAIPFSAVLAAFGFTLLNFFVLGMYEILGFRYIKKTLAGYKILFTSVIAFSFSNNVGFYSISGSAVRYRLYSQMGLSTLDITRLVTFASGITFWLGLCSITALVFMVHPLVLPLAHPVWFLPVVIPGWIFLVPVICFLVLTKVRKRPITFGSWDFEMPATGLTLGLIVAACADWIFFGSVLYVLLPSGTISFPAFFSIFLAAQLAGLISHVPGGLGVFETVIILLMPNIAHTPLIGILVLFRIIYYLMPLAFSALLLALREMYLNRRKIGSIASSVSSWGSGVFPLIFGGMTFVGGVILIISGATPGEHERIHLLTHLMPLPVLEMSHFVASIMGVALLILSWGIYRRYDSAWHLALYMLSGGAVFTFLKGLDYEEAVILLGMMLLLLSGKRFFYRKTSFVNDRFTFRWFLSVAAVVGASIWLGFFSYKHVAYTNELWWQFDFGNHASRFLRATVGVSVFLFGFGLFKLLSPAKSGTTLLQTIHRDLLRPIITTSKQSMGYLAYLADKQFLLSETNDAFIMYGKSKATWVAMGDPIGNQANYASLVWSFKELCDINAARTVFYEVTKEHLPLYLDVGLTLLKIGEEGRVPLSTFSLEGAGQKKSLRYIVRKIESDGYSFSVVDKKDVMTYVPKIKEISDTWLLEKKAREKRFSMGNFSPEYLAEMPLALVSRDGEICAFATIWATDRKEEISIDLMRYSSSAPKGVMDYLFTKLLIYGKEEGYGSFNLGMAPFSGLDSRSMAPIWNRIGAFLFTHGEEYYNFQGLRTYKEKFGPLWEPKYIALPGGLSVPLVLRDIASLVSGGLKGIISK